MSSPITAPQSTPSLLVAQCSIQACCFIVAYIEFIQDSPRQWFNFLVLWLLTVANWIIRRWEELIIQSKGTQTDYIQAGDSASRLEKCGTMEAAASFSNAIKKQFEAFVERNPKKWKSEYNYGTGSSGNPQYELVLTRVDPVSKSSSAVPSGPLDAASLQGPLRDMLTTLNKGKAQTVSLTVTKDGEITVDALWPGTSAESQHKI
jgi:hypothetical protein